MNISEFKCFIYDFEVIIHLFLFLIFFRREYGFLGITLHQAVSKSRSSSSINASSSTGNSAVATAGSSGSSTPSGSSPVAQNTTINAVASAITSTRPIPQATHRAP